MVDLLPELARLVAFDTQNPGGDEPALARYLRDRLQQHVPDVLEVVEVPRVRQRGAYVYAAWGRPRVLVNAHLDTVPPSPGWGAAPHRPRVESDRLIGLGAADVKGSIAAILKALDLARPTNLAILFSGDEECAGTVMMAFLASARREGLAQAVVCEPTRCGPGTRHRGVLAMEVTVGGEGAHSSRADDLPAPIAELAYAAVALHGWGQARRNVGPPGFPGMCMNVAKLAGGVAFNIVPEQATLIFSLRPPPGVDIDTLESELADLVHAHVPRADIATPVASAAFATRDFAAFVPLLGEVGPPCDLGFWTEAALLSGAGIDAVVFGPGDIRQAHAPDEFVSLAQLERARDVFVQLIHAAG